MWYYNILFFGACIGLFACSQTGANGAKDSIFEVTVSIDSDDSVSGFLAPVDLLALDQSYTILHGEKELPFQLDDRNNNQIPDKLYAMVDLPVGGLKTLKAIAGEPTATTPGLQVIHTNIGGESVDVLSLPSSEKMHLDGIVMENEWLGYRLLLYPPYNYDIIGKVTAELVLDTVAGDIQELRKWGGDILNEGMSLGIGSPAIYDFDKIVPFDVFDSREITIRSAGPLYAEIYQVIKGVPIRGEKIDVGITWSMQANKHWSEVEIELLTRTNLTLQFAFGLPRHEEADAFIQGKKATTQFAYTYGLQSGQGDQLGMAILVSDTYDLDLYRDDPHNHFFMMEPVDNKVRYRFLAAWVTGRLTIFDEVDFVQLVRKYAQEFSVQPNVSVKYSSE
ncbi:MAG: DUF4861 domain-containing protein [Saprospiraceae bacterium]|nr:DUF4861 domain-containing protein [Saprospiraceae bacterium]